jgi:PAS domain S-box-containing protein
LNINYQPLQSHSVKVDLPYRQVLIQHCLAESSYTWDLIVNETGQTIYCSSSCKKITGYPPEVFIGNINYLKKIIHQEDKELWPTFMGNSQKSKNRTKEYRIIVSSGEVKWIASFVKPILLGEGTNQGILVSSFDITPYRECVIQLEQKNKILRKRNEDLVKQLSEAYCDIEHNKNKMIAHNKELLETNNALRVLAKNMEQIKKSTEDRLINDIYKNIYPLVSKLNEADTKKTRTRLIDSLTYKIDELCQTLNSEKSNRLIKFLTTTEIMVAALIKEDLRSSEIAKELKMSVATVKTHRRNIRRKLKIQNSRINLANYLKLKWHN